MNIIIKRYGQNIGLLNQAIDRGRGKIIFIIFLFPIFFILLGCAPQLVGNPKETGLVILDIKIVHSDFIMSRNPSPSSASIANDIGLFNGDGYKGLVILSNVKSGQYRVKGIGYKVGNLKVQITLGQEVLDIVKDLNFKVYAGQPVYVGRLVINVHFGNFARKITLTSTQMTYTKEGEIKAWGIMAAEYKKSPWSSRIQKRINELTQ